MSRARTWVAVLALGGVVGCAELTPLEIGACGNSVVEPESQEDCDGVTDDSLGDDLVCGPPGGLASACRYLCSGASCPDGWSCDDDGICHAPSGAFDDSDGPVAVLRAEDIALANVLGEAEFELIARLDGELLVLGTEDGRLRSQVQLSIANPRGPLAFGDVDGDELDDVFVPAASPGFETTGSARVHVLRGDGERLASAVVPQSPEPRPVFVAAAVHSSGGRARELLELVDDGGVVLSVDDPTCADDPPQSQLALSQARAETVLRPISAPRLDGGGQVLIAERGSRSLVRLRVDRSCGPDVCSQPIGERGCATSLTVTQTLELSAAVTEAGCVFVDVDEDAEFDVVCNVADGVEVLIETGGALEPASEAIQDRFRGLSELPAGQSRGCASGDALLAAADLDADGRPDLITAHGLFVATDDGYQRVFARTAGDAWGEVVAGDFDRDGRSEVVATVVRASAECTATGMQHLVQTDGTFSEVGVAEVSLPRRLRTSDFDGDGIDDVAVVEAGTDGERVSVFFGDAKEPLEDKNSVGGFAQVSELVAFPRRDGTNPNDDLVGDLVIVSEAGAFKTEVSGDTRRSLQSPLSFSGAGSPALTTVVGPLLMRPSEPEYDAPDLLVVGPVQSWLLPGDDVHHGKNPIELDSAALGVRAECATWAIGSGGTAGGAIFAGVDGFAHRLVSLDAGCDLENVDAVLSVGVFGGDRSAPQLLSKSVRLPGARRPTRVEVFDLDGSGLDDVIVHVGRADDSGGSVVWLPDPDPTDAALPDPQTLPFGDEIFAIVGANADRDARLELVALTAAGLVVLDFDASAGVFSVSEEPVLVTPADVGTRPAVLAAGDADGDELTDLALLIGDAIYLYPAVPAN